MKTYGEVKVKLHKSLTLALEGDEGSATRTRNPITIIILERKISQDSW